MTVRRPEADGNTRRPKSGLPDSVPHRTLLTLRTAVILFAGLMAGTAIGILTHFVADNLAEAVLAGIAACAGAINFLHAVID